MARASDIKEHMEVLGSDGTHVGTVDHLQGGEWIKLTKDDSPDGQHHFLSIDLIDHVDEHVHLNVPADEAMDEMEDEESLLELADDDESGTSSKSEDALEEEQDDWVEERR